MDRRTFLQQATALGLTVATPGWRRVLAVPIPSAEISGHVVAGKQPLSSVRVSDGFRVARTDAAGRFQIKAGPQSGPFLFVTIPQGYWTDRFFIPTAMAVGHSPVFWLSKTG